MPRLKEDRKRADEGAQQLGCFNNCVVIDLNDHKLMEEGGDEETSPLTGLPVAVVAELIAQFAELLIKYENTCYPMCPRHASKNLLLMTYKAHLNEAREFLAKHQPLTQQ